MAQFVVGKRPNVNQMTVTIWSDSRPDLGGVEKRKEKERATMKKKTAPKMVSAENGGQRRRFVFCFFLLYGAKAKRPASQQRLSVAVDGHRVNQLQLWTAPRPRVALLLGKTRSATSPNNLKPDRTR